MKSEVCISVVEERIK